MDILQMSVSAAVLIIAVIILRAISLYKLPKRTFLVLWGAAVCRLLIPFSLPSRFSLYTSIGILKRALKGTAQSAFPAAPEVFTVIPNTGKAGIGEIAGGASAMSASVSPLAVVYMAGTGVCALFFIIAYIKCLREFKTALPVRNDFIAGWQRRRPLRLPVRIMQSDRIKAPLTYGVFRPVVLLPGKTDWADETGLEYILTHEYVHIRRFDTLLKLLLTVAVCVHWFNPFVWIMYALANRDIELACDEAVVRSFGETKKSDYALTLINLEEKKSRFVPLVSGYGGNAIEERITAIMKTKKITALSITLALVLVTSIIAVFATSAAAKDNEDEVMPQDTLSDWAQCDSDGNLIYYHTVDENGNDVYLDYVPEQPKGDAEMDGLYFVSEKIDCVNGVAGEHKESNGHMAVYTNDGGTWPLKKGNIVYITFDVKKVEGHENGQGINFGYLKDGVYTGYSDTRLIDETSLAFCAPGDGDYNFFFINASSDTIYVNSISIEVQKDKTNDGSFYDFPVNEKGETYGSDADCAPGQEEPDLIAALGTEGQSGYVRNEDILGEDVSNPEEAMEYMEYIKTLPSTIFIPLYDREGNVIGKFAVSNPSGKGDYEYYYSSEKNYG